MTHAYRTLLAVASAAPQGKGSTAFDGLEAAIVIAVLLMTAGSAWGFSQRLAEYR